VVVRPEEPVSDLLIPLITDEAPDTDPEFIRSQHRQLILGRLSREEFWEAMHLTDSAEELEARYMSSFRLVAGLHPFLARMSNNSIPVAAVGNQPRVWGDRLRTMASLDGSLSEWTVSGDVGSALPEPALLEATRRKMLVDHHDSFYLSNQLDHLDMARDLGLATGYFLAGTDETAPETDHDIVRGFDDFVKGRNLT